VTAEVECPAKTPNPGTPPVYCSWNTGTCVWTCTVRSSTPIIIDTDGSGFHLTSVQNGIKWDFNGNGAPIQIAWTAPGSTNGWLAMPDANGQITSAQQLFSSLAPQNLKVADNGFNALVTYDTNGDGVINALDNPWSTKTTMAFPQPNELFTLDQLGITGISLAYTSSPKTDQYGNQFNLKGHLTVASGSNVDGRIYDVTLTTK